MSSVAVFGQPFFKTIQFGESMRDDAEEWKSVCEQAAKEQDPEKLIRLTQRITELLDQRVFTARRDKESEASHPGEVMRDADEYL